MSKPTDYSEALAVELLDRMAEGETLKSICSDQHMPRQRIWRQWLDGQHGAPLALSSLYARARHHQADGFAADIITLADGVDDAAHHAATIAAESLPETATPTEKRRAFFYAKKRSVEGAKLAIDARKWTASRMNPARWGDKVTLEHQIDPDSSIKIDFTDMPTEVLERLAALELELVANSTVPIINASPNGESASMLPATIDITPNATTPSPDSDAHVHA